MNYEIQGEPASELEARFAGALARAHKKFVFKARFLPPTSIPGQSYEVDFIVEMVQPVETDGEYAHKSAEQKAADLVRDAILNEYLLPKGYSPIIRIPGQDIETDEEANALVRRLF